MKRAISKTIAAALLIIAAFASRPVMSQTSSSSPVRPKKEKIIYLTFDADMTPYMKKELLSGKIRSWYDPAIIAYLEDKKIPAAIFATGLFAELYPKEIKQWSEKGLAIENHTYDHSAFRYPCFGLNVLKSDKEKKTEIKKAQEIIFGLTGKAPRLFRYPGLCHNASDDKLVQDSGLTIDNGTLTAGDAFNKNPKSIVKTILSHAKDRSVILMHLGGPNAPAAGRALKQAVPLLQKKGFIFKALGD